MKLTKQVMNRKFSKKLPIERKNSQSKFNNIKYKLKKTRKYKPQIKDIEDNSDEMSGGFAGSIINWFRNSGKRKMLKKIVKIFKKIIESIKLLKKPQRNLILYNKKLKYNVDNHTDDVNMLMYRYQELIVYDKREAYYKALKTKGSVSDEDPDYIAGQIKVDAVEILKINNSIRMHESKQRARKPEIDKYKDRVDREKVKLEAKEFKKIEAALESYSESGEQLEEIKIQLKNYALEAGIKSKEKEDKEVKTDRLKAESFFKFFRNFKVDEKKVAEAYDLYSSVAENLRDIDVNVSNYNSLNRQYTKQKENYDKIKQPLELIFGKIMPQVVGSTVKFDSVIKEYDSIALEYKRLGPAIQNTLIPRIKANKDIIMMANQIAAGIQEELKQMLDYLFTLNPLGSELGKRMELIITNNGFILSYLHTTLEVSEEIKAVLDRGSPIGGGKYITQYGGAGGHIVISDDDFNGNLALFSGLFKAGNKLDIQNTKLFTDGLTIDDGDIKKITDLVATLFGGAASPPPALPLAPAPAPKIQYHECIVDGGPDPASLFVLFKNNDGTQTYPMEKNIMYRIDFDVDASKKLVIFMCIYECVKIPKDSASIYLSQYINNDPSKSPTYEFETKDMTRLQSLLKYKISIQKDDTIYNDKIAVVCPTYSEELKNFILLKTLKSRVTYIMHNDFDKYEVEKNLLTYKEHNNVIYHRLKSEGGFYLTSTSKESNFTNQPNRLSAFKALNDDFTAKQKKYQADKGNTTLKGEYDLALSARDNYVRYFLNIYNKNEIIINYFDNTTPKKKPLKEYIEECNKKYLLIKRKNIITLNNDNFTVNTENFVINNILKLTNLSGAEETYYFDKCDKTEQKISLKKFGITTSKEFTIYELGYEYDINLINDQHVSVDSDKIVIKSSLLDVPIPKNRLFYSFDGTNQSYHLFEGINGNNIDYLSVETNLTVKDKNISNLLSRSKSIHEFNTFFLDKKDKKIAIAGIVDSDDQAIIHRHESVYIKDTKLYYLQFIGSVYSHGELLQHDCFTVSGNNSYFVINPDPSTLILNNYELQGQTVKNIINDPNNIFTGLTTIKEFEKKKKCVTKYDITLGKDFFVYNEDEDIHGNKVTKEELYEGSQKRFIFWVKNIQM